MHRDSFLKYVIERKTEVTSKERRRLDNFKEKREYWKLKEEALYHTTQRTCCGKDYGPVIRQTTKYTDNFPISGKHIHLFFQCWCF
jgi:hypothetical protein